MSFKQREPRGSENKPSRHAAICFGNVKQNSLYFDYVIPVTDQYLPVGLLPPEIEETEYYKRAKLDDSANPIDRPRIHPAVWNRLSKGIRDWLSRGLEYHRYPNVPSIRESDFRYFLQAVSKLCFDLKANGYVPVIVAEQQLVELVTTTGFEAVSIISSQIADIEVESNEWEQLLEFRNDFESSKALRNYKLFWMENYIGKRSEYIHDDLERKYERFRTACKKHGLEIVHTVSKSLVSSRSILASSILALAASSLKEPNMASISILSGTAITLGHITIEISMTRLHQKEFLINSDLLYLYKLSKNFSDMKR